MRSITSNTQGKYGSAGHQAETVAADQLNQFLEHHATKGIQVQSLWTGLNNLLGAAHRASGGLEGAQPLTEAQVKSLATLLENSTFSPHPSVLHSLLLNVTGTMSGGHPVDIQRISDVLAPVLTNLLKQSDQLERPAVNFKLYLDCFLLGHNCSALNQVIGEAFKFTAAGLQKALEGLLERNLPDDKIASFFEDLSSRPLKADKPPTDQRTKEAESGAVAQHHSDVDLARLALQLRPHLHLDATHKLLKAYAESMCPPSTRLIGPDQLRDPQTFDAWLVDCTKQAPSMVDVDLHHCPHEFARHVVRSHLRTLVQEGGSAEIKIFTGRSDAMKQLLTQVASEVSPRWKLRLGEVFSWLRLEPDVQARDAGRKRTRDIAPEANLQLGHPRPWTGAGSGTRITTTTTTDDSEAPAQLASDQSSSTVTSGTTGSAAAQASAALPDAPRLQPTPWQADPDTITGDDELEDGELPPPRK
jgi:hypothetical protein